MVALDNQRSKLFNFIFKVQDKLNKIEKLNTNSIPSDIKNLYDLPREEIKKQVDEELNKYISDDAKSKYLSFLLQRFVTLNELVSYEYKSLMDKVQPKNLPRKERKFNQFRKRRGTW